jgi:hypothetical protein
MSSDSNLESPLFDPDKALTDLFGLLDRINTKAATKLKDELAKVNLERARNRKDFMRVYQLLFGAGMALLLHPSNKAIFAGLAFCKTCVDSAAKTYGDYLNQDLLLELREEVSKDKQALIAFHEEQGMPQEQLDKLKARLLTDDNAD